MTLKVRERFLSALPENPQPIGRLGLVDWAYRNDAKGTSALSAFARAMGLPLTESLSPYATDSDYVARIPIALAREHLVLGVSDGDDVPYLAIGDARSWDQLDILSRFLDRSYRPLLAPAQIVLSAINEAYQQRTGEAQAFIEQLDGPQILEDLQALEEMSGKEDLLDNAARAPVIKLVNLILFEAVKSGASDIHLQPYEDHLVARLRIDGVLFNSYKLPKAVQEEMISRVKVIGRMNIAEKRLPQDGRATVQVGTRCIDLRIASLPTSFGERVVIRLLDKSARLYRLHELGMPHETLVLFRRLINLEHGLVLVTGPTGSGKSTTLYAALKEIDHEQYNILTLEDPIEYQLEGISQTQVSEKKGMTFAASLRNVLRQDPDIIMVGEIRDRETATMAIQSALTGHLVFSTLHTNNAASAVTRLLDLGIEPYLVASSTVGVLAQRLVRRVCADCGQEHPSTPEQQAWLAISESRPLRHGKGCPTCRQTGYRGRVGLFELLTIDETIRRHIQDRATASQIQDAALKVSMKTLRDDGRDKVLSQITTIEEVETVTARILGSDMSHD